MQRKSDKIFLLGEPKSTQQIYRAVCRGRFARVYMNHKGKEVKELYQLQAQAQWGNSMPLRGSISLSARFYFKTRRRADMDNFSKLLLDSMTGIVYEDDGQIDELILRRDYDKESPRIEVEVLLLTSQKIDK